MKTAFSKFKNLFEATSKEGEKKGVNRFCSKKSSVGSPFNKLLLLGTRERKSSERKVLF